MKSYSKLSRVVFLGIMVMFNSQVFCYADPQTIDEIWQITSDDVDSGWGVFTPDDNSIVYFEMEGHFNNSCECMTYSNPRISSIDINSEKQESVAAFSNLSNYSFFQFYKPQWADDGAMAFSYGDSSVITVNAERLLITDMFGDASVYEAKFICKKGNFAHKSYGMVISPDKSQLASLCMNGELKIIPFDNMTTGKAVSASEIISVPVEIDKNYNNWNYELDDWSGIDELFVSEFPAPTVQADYLVRKTSSEESKLFKINSEGKKKYLAKHACCADANPDGALILYIDTQDGEVWVMDNDGNSKTQLTDNGNRKFSPVWSNDGEYISWTELKNVGSGQKKFGQTAGGGLQRYVVMFASLKAVDE